MAGRWSETLLVVAAMTAGCASASLPEDVDAGRLATGSLAPRAAPPPRRVRTIPEVLERFRLDEGAAFRSYGRDHLLLSGPLFRGVKVMSGPDLLLIGTPESGLASCYIPWVDPELEEARSQDFVLEGVITETGNHEGGRLIPTGTPMLAMGYCKVVSPNPRGTSWDSSGSDGGTRGPRQPR